MKEQRKRTLKNLAAAGFDSTEARKVGRGSFRSNLMVLFESLGMERIAHRRGVVVEHRLSPEAIRVFDDLKAGRSHMAIAAGGHTGCWELVGAELARIAEPVEVVVSARSHKDDFVNKFTSGIREGWRLLLIPTKQFMRYFMRNHLDKKPHVYCFFTDQHRRRGGLRVPFFGRPACTVGMPGVLVHRYDTPILLGNCHRESPGHYIVRFDHLDTSSLKGETEEETTEAVTRALAEHVERVVRAAPEQWMWGHRRWRACCEDPPQSEKRIASLSSGA